MVSGLSGVLLLLIYLIVAALSLAIYIKFKLHITGLKWDPAPLAAQICLLKDSNILEAFSTLDFALEADMSNLTEGWDRKNGYLRLGYWNNSARPDEPFYGIHFARYNNGGSDIS